MSRKAALTLLALATLGLAACGKQGDLDRPGPLWGPDARARADAQSRANAASQPRTTAATRRATGQSANAPDDSTSVNGNGPAGTLPIEGDRPNPSGAPPGGSVIPDPYNDPR